MGVGVTNIPGPWRAGQKYTASAYVVAETNCTIELCIGNTGASDNAVGTLAATGSWQRVTITWAPTVDTANAMIAIRKVGSTAVVFYVDAVQIEHGDVATAWRQYISPAVIEGSTITGATIQTAAAGARVRLNGAANALEILDSSSAVAVTLNPTDGLRFSPGIASLNKIEWTIGTHRYGEVSVYNGQAILLGRGKANDGLSSGQGRVSLQAVGSDGSSASIDLYGSPNGRDVYASATNNAGTASTKKILDYLGNSDFAPNTSDSDRNRVRNNGTTNNNGTGLNRVVASGSFTMPRAGLVFFQWSVSGYTNAGGSFAYFDLYLSTDGVNFTYQTGAGQLHDVANVRRMHPGSWIFGFAAGTSVTWQLRSGGSGACTTDGNDRWLMNAVMI
jgi:hypothetical protein